MKRYKTLLTIAGSDSGGGAGIQADMKAASACGCFGMSVITAVTAQNTKGVAGVHIVPAEFVRMQAEAVLNDIGADAVKLGMLPTPEIIDVVVDVITKYNIQNVVLDPVMVATSGDRLISEEAVDRIVSKLLPLSRVVTPNIPEAEFITGMKVDGADESSFFAIAESLLNKGARGAMIKSGHIEGKQVTDYLFDGSIDAVHRYPYVKIDTPNTHGTGCTLSSAIAAFLAQGFPLPKAVERAEDYIHRAIQVGAAYKIGNGHGSVHHFFNFWE